MKNRYVWLLVAIVELIVIIAYFQNIWYTPPGNYPERLFFSVPSDTPVYENYLNQVRAGSFWFYDQMTTEPQQFGIVNIYWLGLGLVGAAFGASASITLLLAQMFSVAALIFSFWYFSKTWLTKTSDRIPALYFATFLSGIGWLTYLVTGRLTEDFIVQMALVFNATLSSPHVAISSILLVAMHLLFFRWVESKRPRYLVIASLLGLILLQFHPYFIFSILLTSLTWTIVRRRTFRGTDVLNYFLYLGVLGLPTFYHLLTTILDPFTRARYATNITPSALPLDNLAAFAPILILAVFGIRQRIRTSLIWQYSLVWFITNVGLMYLPFPIQGRFIQGLMFPVSCAAYLGFKEILKPGSAFRRKVAPFRFFAYPILCIALFGGSAAKLALASQHARVTYLPGGFENVLEEMRALPKGNVLSIPKLSLHIAGRASQTVYVAHWSETLDYKNKADRAARIMQNVASPEEAVDFFTTNRIRYVVAPTEIMPTYPTLLVPIFQNENYTIFEVK